MVVVVGLPVLQGRPALQRSRRAAGGADPGRRAEDVPARLQGVLRGALVLVGARGARSARFGWRAQAAPFGTDLLFQLRDEPAVTIAVEICEDLWAPIPPSSRHAVAGATVILNLSASNDLVGKAEYRRELVMQQSGRTLAAYVYANTGRPRVDDRPRVRRAPADRRERRAARGGRALQARRRARGDRRRRRAPARRACAADLVRRRGARQRAGATGPCRSRRCRQRSRTGSCAGSSRTRSCPTSHRRSTSAAARSSRSRPRVSRGGSSTSASKRVMLGLSGGLDSTLALLVCARTFELLGLPRAGILAVTMPGFGTTARTLETAARAGEGRGRAELREIDIRPACEQHIQDIGLDPRDRESVTFQNLQARERTQVLMDLANKEAGIVVGTSDLSELALGFATFAGDHISMYDVNCERAEDAGAAAGRVGGREPRERRRARRCCAPSSTPRSRPSSCRRWRGRRDLARRPKTSSARTSSHDFFLYWLLRFGAGPRKILFLAGHAFAGQYDAATLRKWLTLFVRPLLRAAVQALGDARTGRRSARSASRRAATGACRATPPPRPGCASSRAGSARDPRGAAVAVEPGVRAGRDGAVPPERRARRRLHARGGAQPLRRRPRRRGGGGLGAAPARPGWFRRSAQDPTTRSTAIVVLGRSEFGFDHLELLEAGANAILPLPPGQDWDDRLMRLIHVPVRKTTRFPVNLQPAGRPALGRRLRRARRQPERARRAARVPAFAPRGRGRAARLRHAAGHGLVQADGTVVRQAHADRFGIELTHVAGDGRVRIKRYVEAV